MFAEYMINNYDDTFNENKNYNIKNVGEKTIFTIYREVGRPKCFGYPGQDSLSNDYVR